MELGALSFALVEDLSALMRYVASVNALKHQMVDEVMSIRKQLDDQENANGDYVRGVHDAYVSLVQALDAVTQPTDPNSQPPRKDDTAEPAGSSEPQPVS